MNSKVTLEYDGSRFAGWARQPGQRTVQETLEGALQTVLGKVDIDGKPLQLTVAGRTDRGVHAWGQVASYRHEALDPGRLNGLLPDDVSVLACEPAKESFDARRDALSRTYCYRLLNRRSRSVRLRDTALWVSRPLDRERLHECASALVGAHDFTAFTPTDTDHVRFERNVLEARWREVDQGASVQGASVQGTFDRGASVQGAFDQGELDAEDGLLEFWIEADTFMRHMNRVLIGTMLDVALARRSVESFRELLDGRPRSQAGATAPAHGLALASVRYPE